jgi:FkbM family methyltransferase
MVDRLLGSILRRAWPTGAVDSLLRSVLLADPGAAAAAWRAFEGSADFDHLTAGELRLIALVSKRLDVLAPTSPMRARLGGIERAHWSRAQMAIAEAGDALRALAAERVGVLVIKGARRAAVDVSTRGLALDAVDVLVRPGDFEGAVDLLTRAGWRPEGSGRTRLQDAIDVRLSRGPVGRLHLHRSAFRSPHASEADDESVWQRSVPGRIACVDVRVPCATDAMAIVLADGVLDVHEGGDRVADVTASIDRGVNWALFGVIAHRRRLHARGAFVLRYVRERLERPVPEAVLRALEGRALRHPRRVLAELRGPHGVGGLVDVLMPARAAVRRGDRRVARYYLRRSIATLVHVIRPLSARLSFVRSTYGPHLLNTPGDRTFELCARGYGPFVAEVIASLDRPFVFLDIGANLGLFSLLAARNPHCEKVVAVEPLPAAFRSLEANIARNGATKIEPIRGAVVTTDEAETYLSFDPRHSGMSRIVSARPDAVCAPVISARTLDGLVQTPASAVIAKIDVEGSEVDVVSTLRQTRFYGAITEMIIEVSARNLGRARRSRLLELLAEDGYEEVSRSGGPEHYDARYRRVRSLRP